MITTKVHFTRTHSVHSLTVIANSSVQVALTWPTIRVTKMTVGTRVTIRWAELRPTLAPTGLLLTVAGRIEVVTVASWRQEEKIIIKPS